MNPFEELYYQHPPVYHFDAVVTACEPAKDGWMVTLDRTAFYPEGGGQPADHGRLAILETPQPQSPASPVKAESRLACGSRESKPAADVSVRHVQKTDGRILHTVTAPLRVGATVFGSVLQSRRKHYTENHTGEHILSGLIHNRFGFDNVGFHMNEHLVTIDFNGVFTWEELLEREEEANRLIRENLPVRELLLSEEAAKQQPYRCKKELHGPIRLIEIPGADLCACCGTHVARTGQVGLIKVLSLMHYKGGVRVEMVCGREALCEMQAKTNRERDIMHLLSVKPQKTAHGVQALLAEAETLKEEKNAAVNRYFDLKIRDFPHGKDALAVDFELFGSPAELRRFCDRLLKENRADTAAVLAPAARQNEADAYWYVIGSQTKNLREAAGLLNRALSGKGGGSEAMIQGTFYAPPDKIKAVLERCFR